MTLAAVTTTVTLLVAVFALMLSFRSWRDSRDKLRLDLFNRRFDIYQHTLTLYAALVGWDDTDEQKALVHPFIEASREALFMFPSQSGVYEYIQSFREHANNVMQHKQLMALFAAEDPHRSQETTALRHQKQAEYIESSKWIANAMPELERLMRPFMAFDRL